MLVKYKTDIYNVSSSKSCPEWIIYALYSIEGGGGSIAQLAQNKTFKCQNTSHKLWFTQKKIILLVCLVTDLSSAKLLGKAKISQFYHCETWFCTVNFWQEGSVWPLEGYRGVTAKTPYL